MSVPDDWNDSGVIMPEKILASIKIEPKGGVLKPQDTSLIYLFLYQTLLWTQAKGIKNTELSKQTDVFQSLNASFMNDQDWSAFSDPAKENVDLAALVAFVKMKQTGK